MRVMGMMSGTSADGIDVALARLSGAPPSISAKLERHHHVEIPARLREDILRLANGAPTTTKEISRLNFALGEEFARAALAACRQWRIPLSKIDLIGSHGQTIFHQGIPSRDRGTRRIASTLQIGEPSIIAERTGVTTIADFRPGDMAAGGQGAPLVPFVDYLLYRHAKRGRVALNIGGIANMTVIPAGALSQDVFAFDTGPGNMIVDALVESFTRGRQRYDRDARMALRGQMIPTLLNKMIREPYLRKAPPKTAGREQFGRGYVARNPLMIAQLAAGLPGIEMIPADRFGVRAEAKEAFAFAVLAYEAFHGRANNLPSATGARHAAVLGKQVNGWRQGKRERRRS